MHSAVLIHELTLALAAFRFVINIKFAFSVISYIAYLCCMDYNSELLPDKVPVNK